MRRALTTHYDSRVKPSLWATNMVLKEVNKPKPAMTTSVLKDLTLPKVTGYKSRVSVTAAKTLQSSRRMQHSQETRDSPQRNTGKPAVTK